MLTARAGSGLEQVGGNEDARHDQFWVSAAQQVGVVNLRGRVGRARAAARDLTTLCDRRGLHAVRRAEAVRRAQAPASSSCRLEPSGSGCARWDTAGSSTGRRRSARTLPSTPLYQTLSDGNRRWEFTLSPRRSVARTERLNLDLGVVVSQLAHDDELRQRLLRSAAVRGTTRSPPTRTGRSAKASASGLSLALGAQRDDFSPGFRFGGNATGEATFGIYRPVGAQSDRRRQLQSAARKRRVPRLRRRRVPHPTVLNSFVIQQETTGAHRSCAH